MKVRFELVEGGQVVVSEGAPKAFQWVEERPADWGRDPLGLVSEGAPCG